MESPGQENGLAKLKGAIPTIEINKPEDDNTPTTDTSKPTRQKPSFAQRAITTPGFIGFGGLKKRSTAPETAHKHPHVAPRRNTAPARTGDAPPLNSDDSKGWLAALLKPENRISSKTPSLTTCFKNIVLYSWINILLVFIPIAWAMEFTHKSDTLIFVFCFLSIIPLAALLGFATEELALRVGPTLGGLLNATLGNAVELIIAIIALKQNQLRIVQASMLGSFLSNCLLVLGCCFFAGGLRFHEQSYGARIAQQQISLLSLSVFSVVVPAAFVNSSGTNVDQNGILSISRAVSIVLLICYGAYLLFQLYTHKYLYTLEASKENAQGAYETAAEGVIGPEKGQAVFRVPSVFRKSSEEPAHGSTSQEPKANSEETTTETATVSKRTTDKKNDDALVDPEAAKGEDSDDEEEEEPQLKVWIAALLLVVVTVFTGVTAEFLVSSIDGMTSRSHINKEFVALILLPLVGNAAEHVTAVTVSVKNKLDLALGVAIGSSIQIFLFVLPLLVCIAWGLDKPLTLNFDVFETVVVTLSIVVVSYAIADGRTNWLEGFVLMILYVIIAIATWFHQSEGLEGA